MPTSNINDKYSNIFQVNLVESAANTLTFIEIQLGLTIFQKIALILNRIEVDWGAATWLDMDNDGDTCLVGLTASNSLSSIAYSDPATIWKQQIMEQEHGTPANALKHHVVDVVDFSTLPGGGQIIAPKPLYGAIQSNGLTAVHTVVLRVFFQILEMKPEEYFQLLESRNFYGT